LGDRAIVVPKACGTSRQEIVLYQSNLNWGDNRVTAPGEEANWDTVRICESPLDDILSAAEVDFHDIDVLWIDVQGAEVDSLRSAEAVLRGGCNVVLEYDPYLLRMRSAETDREFVEAVVGLGGVIVDLRTGTILSPEDLTKLGDELFAKGLAGYTDLAVLRR
jgi:hypothetical protein